jgi:alcohol dehydrogenase class IV
MAVASLFGGLALENAKLGAVHGFAGVLGGTFHAPHGAICACLLPHVMTVNVQAIQQRQPDNPVLVRYREVAQMVTADHKADVGAGVRWIQELVQDLEVAPLSTFGITPEDRPQIIEKAQKASSMKGNPILLTVSELDEILTRALGDPGAGPSQ